MVELLRQADAFSEGFSHSSSAAGLGVESVSALRQLKTVYAMPVGKLFTLLTRLAANLTPTELLTWERFAADVRTGPNGQNALKKLLLKGGKREFYEQLFSRLEEEDPHAIYPTSSYRNSSGQVTYEGDGQRIEAVMSTSAMTEILITEDVLNFESDVLLKLYQPLGRCVSVVDANVEEHYGEEINAYFAYHGIKLTKLVYRAMEVDKGIRMVELLLGDFKNAGVSREEPVLVVGGGVLADTAGLACALYHRNTPYVMLATSIVAGIDAGPSPRTCCDGHGYKNLFGAYHAPVMTITDRTFFRSLRKGWMRHGVAEIIKMAVVKDLALFELLEETGFALVDTHFGADTNSADLKERGNRVLSAAMRSYVEAEYGNLYETHQCRPHAYGHTWSPGFEIPSGMLHGHAVGCGMGFGAYLSYLQGWITAEERDRIMRLISNFELSLWHPVLEESDLIFEAQERVTQKRGGNLAAPLPKGGIGTCGYLNELTREDLASALADYQQLCELFPRQGLGVEAHCHEVGLENPSVTGHFEPIKKPAIATVS
ncbi:sedoheptulose 7-phosphate cyclase [Lewinella sp. 4G2]|uniref:sedoheptulose 7-phosphate cyclase n=1 Tax=Lewinella sp. 4G2 TaxID=1803372 RepID=UPI0018D49F8F|nr:sedoheptulose 7-phosphate cyclase [Lewinella sp. 4G2]